MALSDYQAAGSRGLGALQSIGYVGSMDDRLAYLAQDGDFIDWAKAVRGGIGSANTLFATADGIENAYQAYQAGQSATDMVSAFNSGKGFTSSIPFAGPALGALGLGMSVYDMATNGISPANFGGAMTSGLAAMAPWVAGAGPAAAVLAIPFAATSILHKKKPPKFEDNYRKGTAFRTDAKGRVYMTVPEHSNIFRYDPETNKYQQLAGGQRGEYLDGGGQEAPTGMKWEDLPVYSHNGKYYLQPGTKDFFNIDTIREMTVEQPTQVQWADEIYVTGINSMRTHDEAYGVQEQIMPGDPDYVDPDPYNAGMGGGDDRQYRYTRQPSQALTMQDLGYPAGVAPHIGTIYGEQPSEFDMRGEGQNTDYDPTTDYGPEAVSSGPNLAPTAAELRASNAVTNPDWIAEYATSNPTVFPGQQNNNDQTSGEVDMTPTQIRDARDAYLSEHPGDYEGWAAQFDLIESQGDVPTPEGNTAAPDGSVAAPDGAATVPDGDAATQPSPSLADTSLITQIETELGIPTGSFAAYATQYNDELSNAIRQLGEVSTQTLPFQGMNLVPKGAIDAAKGRVVSLATLTDPNKIASDMAQDRAKIDRTGEWKERLQDDLLDSQDPGLMGDVAKWLTMGRWLNQATGGQANDWFKAATKAIFGQKLRPGSDTGITGSDAGDDTYYGDVNGGAADFDLGLPDRWWDMSDDDFETFMGNTSWLGGGNDSGVVGNLDPGNYDLGGYSGDASGFGDYQVPDTGFDIPDFDINYEDFDLGNIDF